MSECWQYLWIVSLAQRTIVSFFSLINAQNKMSRRVLTPALGVLRLFFFFYLVWWHLTLITPKHPDIVPIIPFPRHSCQVRASLNESEHTLDRMRASKCLSLFCRDAFITLARTVRRRNRTVPLSRDKLQCSDLGRAKWEREREKKTKKDNTVASSKMIFIQTCIIATFHKVASPKSLPEPIPNVNFKCSLHFHLYRVKIP